MVKKVIKKNKIIKDLKEKQASKFFKKYNLDIINTKIKKYETKNIKLNTELDSKAELYINSNNIIKEDFIEFIKEKADKTKLNDIDKDTLELLEMNDLILDNEEQIKVLKRIKDFQEKYNDLVTKGKDIEEFEKMNKYINYFELQEKSNSNARKLRIMNRELDFNVEDNLKSFEKEIKNHLVTYFENDYVLKGLAVEYIVNYLPFNSEEKEPKFNVKIISKDSSIIFHSEFLKIMEEFNKEESLTFVGLEEKVKTFSLELLNLFEKLTLEK